MDWSQSAGPPHSCLSRSRDSLCLPTSLSEPRCSFGHWRVRSTCSSSFPSICSLVAPPPLWTSQLDLADFSLAFVLSSPFIPWTWCLAHVSFFVSSPYCFMPPQGRPGTLPSGETQEAVALLPLPLPQNIFPPLQKFKSSLTTRQPGCFQFTFPIWPCK